MNDSEDGKVISEGWDDVDKSIGSGGKYFKLADNQKATINIYGKPKHVKREFQGKVNDRVALDVYVFGSDDAGCKTWEASGATYRDIKEEREALKAGEFENALFTVKRTGSNKDTRYRFRYERQLTPAEVAMRSDAAAAVGQSVDPF